MNVKIHFFLIFPFPVFLSFYFFLCAYLQVQVMRSSLHGTSTCNNVVSIHETLLVMCDTHERVHKSPPDDGVAHIFYE